MAGEYRDAVKDAVYPKRKGIVTVRNKYLKVAPLDEFSPAEIKKLRLSLSLSVRMLAELLGVTSKAVEAWESGVNTPSGAAKRLLSMLKKDPDFLFEYQIMIDRTSLR